jgi:AraC-like DNA-binding protein
MHGAEKPLAQIEVSMSQISCVFSWMLAVKAGYRCQPHAHPCTEIVFSEKTAGMLSQGGRDLAYGDQSVFVYQPNAPHWIENRCAGEQICIGVVGCQSEVLPEGVWAATPIMRRCFDDIRRALANADRLQAMRLDLLSGMVVCELLSLQPSICLPPRNRAQQARDIIESGLTTPFTLQQLARRVYVSPEYLRQLFRKEFGESITSYVIRRRIELAARLLRTRDDPIKNIANEAGFPNEYYFSRVFRKVVGVSPSQWRRAEKTSGS